MPSTEEVEELIRTGQEAALVGVFEADRLDFKQQPHLLQREKGKWELAKDVAALANAGGGCLVVGVTTEVSPDTDEEVASEITPFPSSMADPQQIRATVDSGVYPAVRGLRIDRHGRPDGKALMTIAVPEQDGDGEPFMVLRMVEGDEKRGVGVGVPLRSGSHTIWLSPGEIHRNLSDGLRSRRESRLSGSGQDAPGPLPSVDNGERIRQRFDEIEQYMGWAEAPTLLLAAVPAIAQTIPIRDFYSPQGVLGSIADPPTLRFAGFGIGGATQPENLNGSLVSPTGQRQVLWVDPDGATFVACTGTQAFLTRSGGSREAVTPEPRIVNPTVVVEWTYLSCLFVEQIIQPLVDGDLEVSIHLRGSSSRPWTLRMVKGKAAEWFVDGSPAGLDDFAYAMKATGNPASDAHELLVHLYGVFGLTADAVPYSSEGAVDPDAIRALNAQG